MLHYCLALKSTLCIVENGFQIHIVLTLFVLRVVCFPGDLVETVLDYVNILSGGALLEYYLVLETVEDLEIVRKRHEVSSC